MFKSNQQGNKINMVENRSGNPGSTLFRKSAVSGFHKAAESSEMRDNLADLMAHNVSTAQKYYKLQEKSMASVKAVHPRYKILPNSRMT